MHLWWSRKPLGIARAVLFASLVDDPSSRPDRFASEAAQTEERQRLFEMVGALSRWDRSNDVELLKQARHRIDEATNGDRPCLIDPFCGGGSIPIEGIRLGLDTVAIDLNPVAAVVTSSAVAIAQRFAGRGAVNSGTASRLASGTAGLSGIADDVRFYGESVERVCRDRLQWQFKKVKSPASPGGTTVPVSYLWTRTIICTNPGCRRETPLLSTWWLCKKPTNRWHVRPTVERDSFNFTVHRGPPPPRA